MSNRLGPLLACCIGAWLVAGCTAVLPGRAPSQPTAASLPSDYFDGKTIALVVNFSAGGPTDVFARLIARHLGRHVPGTPTVVVQDMPGAGGKIGANQVYAAARKDGLTIGVFTSPFANQLLHGEGAQYDSARFVWLGGVSEGDIAFVNSSVGVKAAGELPTTSAEIVVGGLSPDSGQDISERTILNMWGVNYKYVSGYAGNAEASNALLRNEVNFLQVSLMDWFSSMAPLVRDGSVLPIAQSGVLQHGEVVRDPRVPEIPTYQEIALDLNGPQVQDTVAYRASVALLKIQGALLRAIVLPPGTDQTVVETLRKALADTMADEAFRADARKAFGYELPFLTGEDAQALATEIVEGTDAETLDYLRTLSR